MGSDDGEGMTFLQCRQKSEKGSFIWSVMYGRMKDPIDKESSEEDQKPAAVGEIAEMIKQRQDVVEICAANAVSGNADEMERIMEHGMQQYTTTEIERYLEVVEAAVPRDFYTQFSIANVENVKSNLFRRADARKGLGQMVNICLAVVDLFCFCKIDMFTGSALGITHWIQVAMSKSFLESERESGCSHVINEPSVLHFSLLRKSPL